MATAVAALFQNTVKLRDLIVAVRGCKTSAEERATVQKECAAIRESFSTGKEAARHRNMLKLMYISMLGYSTEFAQMEVVKMLAKPDYADKRIGYLALTILLDETTEVLTLAEHGIKRDLMDQQLFTQGLALATVANVAGEDMSRDVMNEVTSLLANPHKSLQKKACLAALRIVRRIPEFSEVFLDKMTDILHEQQHGTLVAGLSLVNQCLVTGCAPQYLKNFRAVVPQAIRLLKALMLSATQHDSDVQGVGNPFLQVKLLQFLRVVAQDDIKTSEAINDILAQVATNTESSKSVGSAILYECARTIFAIHADEGLKVLGVNILARFLTSSKDNNLRYVALSTLLHVYPRDPEAVRRHQVTVIDCLKDADVSIRKRALDLTVALIDSHNVRALTPDLLQYLGVCGEEMKPLVTQRVCEVIEAQSPSPEWRVEMSLRVFRSAKAPIDEGFGKRFIAHVTNQPASTRTQAVQTLWEEVSLPFDAQMHARLAMVLAAVWCVGEYCDLLVEHNGGATQFAEQVAGAVYGIINSTLNSTVKQYCLTALAKIVCKFPQTAALVSGVFELQASNLDCELQQRACEYLAMLESFPELAQFSLSPIPPIVAAEETPSPELPSGPNGNGATVTNGTAGTKAPASQPPADLFADLFAPGPTIPDAPPPAVATVAPVPPPPSRTNVLHDLFGEGGASPNAKPSGGGATEELFQATPFRAAPQPTSPPSQAPKRIEVYRCADLTVSLSLVSKFGRADFSKVEVAADVVPTSASLTQFEFLVSVPKTVTVEIKPLPRTTVTSSEPLRQLLVLDTNDPNGGRQLMLRVRLQYLVNGSPKVEQFQISQDLTQL